MTTPNPFNSAPISTNEDDWKPVNYLLRVTESRCQCCNETITSSTLWKASINRKHPTVHRELPILDLARVTDKLPVVKLTTHKTQPICHLCPDAAAELGYIATFQEIDEIKWKAAVVQAERALSTAARAAARTKPVVHVDLSTLL